MKRLKRLIKTNLSFITADKILTQILNVVYYFIVARILDKESLGIYNWLIAISTTISIIISFGIAPIITRKVASDNSQFFPIVKNLTIYFLGISISFVFGATLFLLISREGQTILILLAVAQALISNINIPVRQAMLGMENYKVPSIANIINVCIKLILGLLGIYLFVSVEMLLLALLFSHIFSFIYYLIKLNRIAGYNSEIKYKRKFVRQLLMESLPMLGVIIFNTALARFDWILLGYLKTAEETADYTFTYKIYEISWLPHALFGVFLLPQLSKIVLNKEVESKAGNWFKGVFSFALIIPFILAIIWSPLVDYLTNYKYGSANQLIFELLAGTVPLTAGISFMWNLAIAQRKDKQILIITVVTTIINIVLNVYLINIYGGLGAALTTIATTVLQFSLYYFIFKEIKTLIYCLKILLGAIIFYFIIQTFIANNILLTIVITTSIIIYFGYLFKKRDYFSFIK